MPPTKRKAPNRGTTKKNKKSKVVKAQGNTSDKKSRNPPQYIPAAEASRSKSDEESVQNDPDMLEGSDVDDEGAKAFISGLDIKQISRSRQSVREEWKRNKHKVEQGLSKTSKLLASLSTNAEPSTSKVQLDDPEGVPINALEEDDFAFGSGESDDDLSIMSDIESIESDLLSEKDEDTLSSSSDLEDELGSDFDLTNAYEEAMLPNEGSIPEQGVISDEDVLEQAYEGKKLRRTSSNIPAKPARLPVKLPNGVVQQVEKTSDNSISSKRQVTFAQSEDESVEGEEMPQQSLRPMPRSDPLGPRFGRMGVRSILELDVKQDRLLAARQELAALSNDIMADPENSLNLLKRLLAFCGKTFSGNKGDTASSLPIDQPIRALALLSMLAVFLDIIPQYRIRELTDVEKSTKVSQAVTRQRDYETGLVGVYKRYLEVCEKDVNNATPLSTVALKCLCDLLQEKSQFNFSINIMDIIVKQVGKADWDESSKACLQTIIHLFEHDIIGSDSLHLVRLLSRTIKARSFQVHPALIGSFLFLRLSSDLKGIRASGDRISREGNIQKRRPLNKKQAELRKPHLSKKAKKAMKDKREVEKEFAEAEMTVSAEEKQKERTETLKILFALYFRLIKLESKTALLAPTLEGLAAFAHMINVDFFKDLLDNLRVLLRDTTSGRLAMRERLLCIVTAFDLLSGQGEALNIDLADFVADLYNLLVPLSLSLSLEDKPQDSDIDQTEADKKPLKQPRSLRSSESDLLFRALTSVFITSRIKTPPSRMLAFAKRLLTCTASLPTASALRAIDLVRKMLVKEPALGSMLFVDDSPATGVYNAETSDLNLVSAEGTSWWELSALADSHFDERVREAALNLSRHNGD